jgi:hypothetical protein
MSVRCDACRYFVPTCGAFETAVGACASATSRWDQQAVPGSHGCQSFEAQLPAALYRTESFFSVTHDRWTAGSAEPEIQCGGCAFFILLDGAFIRDWGVCANSASSQDGIATFEHAGCDQFEPSAMGWSGAIPSASLDRRSRTPES